MPADKPFEKDPNEIGVLWRKTGEKGEFLSGEINGQQVVVFPIKSTNPKAPNYRVLKSQPRNQPPQQRSPRLPVNKSSVPIDDDDIAF